MKYQLLILMLIILMVDARRKKKPSKPSKSEDSREPNEYQIGKKEPEPSVAKKEAPPRKNDEASFSLNLKEFSINVNVPASFINLLFGGGHRGPPAHQDGYGGPEQGGYGGPEQGGYGGPEQAGGSMLCWDWTLGFAVNLGTIMIYNNNTYTCTDNDWEKNPPDSSQVDGCWSPFIHKVFSYGTSGYYCCDKVECKSDQSWQVTGETLPNCYPGNFLCWNWMTSEAVKVGSTMYFECNQYVCLDEDDWRQNGERDPTCETNGCFSVVTQEIVPYGGQGYWKCESIECMPNNKWKHTGGKLPGCGLSRDNGNSIAHNTNGNTGGNVWPFKPNELSVQVNAKGETFCWDWTKTAAVPEGSIMHFDQDTYKCENHNWKKIQ